MFKGDLPAGAGSSDDDDGDDFSAKKPAKVRIRLPLSDDHI